ncbi:MAG: hypothetical protein VX922_07630, partial [Candidatus Neomarinimicrobiota bacterium]|nr:hypothetical protein [Candidatus Neomarinimicrobiota bacterium]
MRINFLKINLIVLFTLFFSCTNQNTSYSKIPIEWKKFNWNQYNGIEILEGRNSLLPLNVWVAIIDNNDPN